ncbi:phosphomannomutase [Marisediminicola sp. UYEF4]|uniref:phosphomannomutase/phosphoglucomutase n=1 Tax=Marisediminicola sp. UYEF4 TaxID=1756384 RepID=UPI003393C6D3
MTGLQASTGPIDLAPFIKAYDVRGLVGSQLTVGVVRALGAAFADEVGTPGGEIIVGHDMRDSSPGFAEAFSAGVRDRGVNVVGIGLCSTDETYYASGHLDLPAAMFTASHNPATYNGIKFSRAGAQGISFDTGLRAIRDRATTFLAEGIDTAEELGGARELAVLADYAAYLRALVDLSGIRPLRVVVDTGNGMGGLTVPAVLGAAAGLPELPIEVIPLYFELDGTFPNHEANPLDPANIVDLQRAVLEHGADLGLAFDGDADRCFVVDEKGEGVTPSAIAAIVALRAIERATALDPDGEVVVLHNLITSRVVPETIVQAGAIPVRTKVGHSLIKDEMAATGAVFGGEHSAHYYFKEFWGADNGMLAAMYVLAELGHQSDPMSGISARFTPYALSGEINSTVTDIPGAYSRIVDEFVGMAEFDELDGLTVTGIVQRDAPFWWFNVRPSNTEPLLRLNVEAGTNEEMLRIRDVVLGLIRG